ncbi:adenine phosphoribosyltransferase [Aurantiacibacter spongiae]|uniref:Adenine phosphoribosyltransferase n=1 Tax=Aurantiacibacter spongiae TaxID=2488860 RepID=A0A3N5DI14_9SPHN|nr:adenine phosphoribosyltransferase [Aurantiacibacter spongiae]RPF71312.1 adenine phosphoribosyltransferase [Aurantiacibacter spongiae]
MGAEELKALIRTVPDFPAPGIQFRDVTTLLADAGGLAGAVDGLVGLTRDLPVASVAGIEARGFIFGAALALSLGVGFIPMRKAGKLPVETLGEDYKLEYGVARLEVDPSVVVKNAEVLIVDDLLATGGTALAATHLLRRAGARVADAVFVVDLPDIGGSKALEKAGVATRALVAYGGH